MKITKHQADKEGVIHINGVVRLLTMGLQDDKVTIWAVTDPLDVAPVGKLPMRYKILSDGEMLKMADLQNYVSTFMNDKGGVWHLFVEQPKLTPVQLKQLEKKPPLPPQVLGGK